VRLERDFTADLAAARPGITNATVTGWHLWSPVGATISMDGLHFGNALTVQHNVLGGGFKNDAGPLALGCTKTANPRACALGWYETTPLALDHLKNGAWASSPPDVSSTERNRICFIRPLFVFLYARIQYPIYPFHPIHLCEYKTIQLLVFFSQSPYSLLKNPPISYPQILLLRTPQ
jgi:hypothetical protein